MIEDIVKTQREFFESGETLSYDFRKNALIKLKKAILSHEEEIKEALKKDLGKSSTESYMCEIGMVLSELSFAIKHLKSWMKKKRAKTPLAQFHSKSFVVKEPLGVVLVMSPWNYPFMLALDPLVGALAAGNCVVLKPASYAKNTSLLMKQILSECFEEKYVAVVLGGREENAELLEQNLITSFSLAASLLEKSLRKKLQKI